MTWKIEVCFKSMKQKINKNLENHYLPFDPLGDLVSCAFQIFCFLVGEFHVIHFTLCKTLSGALL